MKKFEVGELVKFTNKYSKWASEYADEVHSVAGTFRFKTVEEILDWGVNKFSHPNKLEIFAMIEGENAENGELFAYRVYFFNELGEGWCFMSPENLERL